MNFRVFLSWVTLRPSETSIMLRSPSIGVSSMKTYGAKDRNEKVTFSPESVLAIFKSGFRPMAAKR